MQNKQTLLFVLTFLFLVIHSRAQSSVFDHPLSAQYLGNFDAVCAQLADRSYTKGIFRQTRTMKRQNRSLVSNGDFIIAADLGLVWITKSPVPSITTLGRDYMIRFVPGGTGTRIESRGNEIYLNMADTISSLFTGNIKKLKSDFDNYYTEAQTADGKIWTIGLVPRENTLRNYAQRIVLEGFDGEGGVVIRSIAIHEKSGDSLTYVFSAQSFPDALEAHEKTYFSAD